MDDNAQQAPVAVPHIELTLPGAPDRQRLHDRGGLLLGANWHHDAHDRKAENLLRGVPVQRLRGRIPGDDHPSLIRLDPRSALRPTRAIRDQSRGIHCPPPDTRRTALCIVAASVRPPAPLHKGRRPEKQGSTLVPTASAKRKGAAYTDSSVTCAAACGWSPLEHLEHEGDA